MKRKLRSVAALLLVVTCVIYVIALVQSIRAYEVWKQVRLEEIPSHLRPYVDFGPYMDSPYGVRMIMAGALITLGWLTVAIILSKGKLSYRKRSKEKEQSLQA